MKHEQEIRRQLRGVNATLFFWCDVDKTEDKTSCWSWLGIKTCAGYGQVLLRRYHKKKHTVGAHVAGYLIANPEPLGDLHVLHSCHNRLCVNPDHLRAGTRKENSQDMIKAGRALTGARNGQSILIEEQVLEIKKILKTTTLTCSTISRKYGVSRNTIKRIEDGTSWRDTHA